MRLILVLALSILYTQCLFTLARDSGDLGKGSQLLALEASLKRAARLRPQRFVVLVDEPASTEGTDFNPFAPFVADPQQSLSSTLVNLGRKAFQNQRTLIRVAGIVFRRHYHSFASVYAKRVQSSGYALFYRELQRPDYEGKGRRSIGAAPPTLALPAPNRAIPSLQTVYETLKDKDNRLPSSLSMFGKLPEITGMNHDILVFTMNRMQPDWFPTPPQTPLDDTFTETQTQPRTWPAPPFVRNVPRTVPAPNSTDFIRRPARQEGSSRGRTETRLQTGHTHLYSPISPSPLHRSHTGPGSASSSGSLDEDDSLQVQGPRSHTDRQRSGTLRSRRSSPDLYRHVLRHGRLQHDLEMAGERSEQTTHFTPASPPRQGERDITVDVNFDDGGDDSDDGSETSYAQGDSFFAYDGEEEEASESDGELESDEESLAQKRMVGRCQTPGPDSPPRRRARELEMELREDPLLSGDEEEEEEEESESKSGLAPEEESEAEVEVELERSPSQEPVITEPITPAERSDNTWSFVQVRSSADMSVSPSTSRRGGGGAGDPDDEHDDPIPDDDEDAEFENLIALANLRRDDVLGVGFGMWLVGLFTARNIPPHWIPDFRKAVELVRWFESPNGAVRSGEGFAEPTGSYIAKPVFQSPTVVKLKGTVEEVPTPGFCLADSRLPRTLTERLPQEDIATRFDPKSTFSEPVKIGYQQNARLNLDHLPVERPLPSLGLLVQIDEVSSVIRTVGPLDPTSHRPLAIEVEESGLSNDDAMFARRLKVEVGRLYTALDSLAVLSDSLFEPEIGAETAMTLPGDQVDVPQDVDVHHMSTISFMEWHLFMAREQCLDNASEETQPSIADAARITLDEIALPDAEPGPQVSIAEDESPEDVLAEASPKSLSSSSSNYEGLPFETLSQHDGADETPIDSGKIPDEHTQLELERIAALFNISLDVRSHSIILSSSLSNFEAIFERYLHSQAAKDIDPPEEKPHSRPVLRIPTRILLFFTDNAFACLFTASLGVYYLLILAARKYHAVLIARGKLQGAALYHSVLRCREDVVHWMAFALALADFDFELREATPIYPDDCESLEETHVPTLPQAQEEDVEATSEVDLLEQARQAPLDAHYYPRKSFRSLTSHLEHREGYSSDEESFGLPAPRLQRGARASPYKVAHDLNDTIGVGENRLERKLSSTPIGAPPSRHAQVSRKSSLRHRRIVNEVKDFDGDEVLEKSASTHRLSVVDRPHHGEIAHNSTSTIKGVDVSYNTELSLQTFDSSDSIWNPEGLYPTELLRAEVVDSEGEELEPHWVKETAGPFSHPDAWMSQEEADAIPAWNLQHVLQTSVASEMKEGMSLGEMANRLKEIKHMQVPYSESSQERLDVTPKRDMHRSIPEWKPWRVGGDCNEEEQLQYELYTKYQLDLDAPVSGYDFDDHTYDENGDIIEEESVAFEQNRDVTYESLCRSDLSWRHAMGFPISDEHNDNQRSSGYLYQGSRSAPYHDCDHSDDQGDSDSDDVTPTQEFYNYYFGGKEQSSDPYVRENPTASTSYLSDKTIILETDLSFDNLNDSSAASVASSLNLTVLDTSDDATFASRDFATASTPIKPKKITFDPLNYEDKQPPRPDTAIARRLWGPATDFSTLDPADARLWVNHQLAGPSIRQDRLAREDVFLVSEPISPEPRMQAFRRRSILKKQRKVTFALTATVRGPYLLLNEYFSR